MTKKKSAKKIKVMAIVMALSVIVCGVAVGVAASTKSDDDDYWIMTADGQDIGKGIPYEESTDINKVIEEDMRVNQFFKEYDDIMDPVHLDAYELYMLHAKWVYDEADHIYKIDFKQNPKISTTYGILQYNSYCHYLKKFLNKDNLTPEQIEKIKNFKYPEGF